MFKKSKPIAALAIATFWLVRVILSIVAVAAIALSAYAFINAFLAHDDFRHGAIRLGALLAFCIVAFVLMFGFMWSQRYLDMLKPTKAAPAAGASQRNKDGAAVSVKGGCGCGTYSQPGKKVCCCNEIGDALTNKGRKQERSKKDGNA